MAKSADKPSSFSPLGIFKRKLQRKISFFVSSIKMQKIDTNPVPIAPNELRLFVMVRNESLRIPYFLKYYFQKGVDRVFLIDNNSDDDTVAVASSFNNVHIFRTKENFRNYSNWMELLLDRYGKNQWCIAADADEIFQFPFVEKISIKALCTFLDQAGFNAVRCLLLDMYSDKPIEENDYKAGDDPLTVTPYFDAEYEAKERTLINRRTIHNYVLKCFTGNMRKRVFGAEVNLTKVPLFKYVPGIFVARGIHAIDGANIADIQGTVLHFKYLQDFNKRVISEVARGQHEGGAADYKKYAKIINSEDQLNLYFEGSKKFQGSSQLLALGLMHSSSGLDQYVASLSEVD